MIVSILGAPVVGRGNQAEILSRRLDTGYISVGALLRKHRQNQTNLGKQADSYIHVGNLVPPALFVDIIVQHLESSNCLKGAIIDSFPKIVEGAELLDSALASENKHLDTIVYIDVSLDILVERMSQHWLCLHCRSRYHKMYDPPDTPGVCDYCGHELINREWDRRDAELHLASYFASVTPVLEYYRTTNRLIEIDGEQDFDKVTEDLIAAIRR